MSKIVLKYNGKLLKRNGSSYLGYDGTPICDFNASGSSASQITINAGDKLNFYDTSLKNPTSWNWSLGAGSPSTSTVQNPTGITFSTTGVSNISLTVSNNFGISSKTKSSYINVQDIQLKKLAINIFAPANGGVTPYYTGVTWTPSGMSQRSWTWNYLCSDLMGQTPTTGCTMSLKYTDNTSSNYTVRIGTPVFDSAYDNGKTTDNNTGIYPDSVLKYSLVNTSFAPMILQKIRLSGLNTSTTYKLTFLASRGAWTATSRFTITGGTNKDGTSVTQSVNDNVMNTVNVTGISPSSGGIIDIGVDYTNSGGYINAIEIDEGG